MSFNYTRQSVYQQPQYTVYPLMKYVRSPHTTPHEQIPLTTVTNTNEWSSFSLSNVVSTASSFFTRKHRPPPTVFNVQQQFELECIEMIESENFQNVLSQMVEQSFSCIYDEFARDMALPFQKATIENHQNDSELLNPQLPLAKLIPVANNIYKKFSSNQEQLILHFQSLACRKELHDYTKYAYDLFANESSQSPSRTAFSMLPTFPFNSSSMSSNFDFSTFFQSLMQR